MTALARGDWTWLELAKLIVAALTPLLVVGLGVLINRTARRIEQAQWATRRLIERRLELFDSMAPGLNDLLCFFLLVGDFRKITPPVAIARKRELDKQFYVNEALMSPEFAARYHAFIAACFQTYTGTGHEARLRASQQRHMSERAADWNAEWTRCFVQQDSLIVSPTAIHARYRELMTTFAEQVGVSEPHTAREPQVVPWTPSPEPSSAPSLDSSVTRA